MQLEEYESAENIFSDYAYFASLLRFVAEALRKVLPEGCGRDSALEQAELRRWKLPAMTATCCSTSCEQGVPVLGIEPAANVAKAAIEKGVPTLVRFFGAEVAKELAAEGRTADLVIGNNVLAQVPDLNDFVEGLKILLKPDGVLTLEFPHLLRLIEHNEFDTIYHEHFSYFSLISTVTIWRRMGCAYST